MAKKIQDIIHNEDVDCSEIDPAISSLFNPAMIGPAISAALNASIELELHKMEVKKRTGAMGFSSPSTYKINDLVEVEDQGKGCRFIGTILGLRENRHNRYFVKALDVTKYPYAQWCTDAPKSPGCQFRITRKATEDEAYK